MHWAVEHGADLDVYQLLIANGCDRGHTNGETLLEYARRLCRSAEVLALLDPGNEARASLRPLWCLTR